MMTRRAIMVVALSVLGTAAVESSASARYYSPQLGRFLSPDIETGRLEGPQSLHKYSYTLNNPYRFVDPSGHDPADATGGPTPGFGIETQTGIHAIDFVIATKGAGGGGLGSWGCGPACMIDNMLPGAHDASLKNERLWNIGTGGSSVDFANHLLTWGFVYLGEVTTKAGQAASAIYNWAKIPPPPPHDPRPSIRGVSKAEAEAGVRRYEEQQRQMREFLGITGKPEQGFEPHGHEELERDLAARPGFTSPPLQPAWTPGR